MLGKPMEFRQEFVRPSVAYVTNKEMPRRQKTIPLSASGARASTWVRTDSDARKSPEDLTIGFNVPDGPEGRVSGELRDVLFGHGNNGK